MADAAPATATSGALRAAAVLGAFTLVGVALLAYTDRATRPRIEANAEAALRAELGALLPAGAHDNDLLADRVLVSAPALTGSAAPVAVHRARKAGRPVALLYTLTAPDGYSGPIRMLVGVTVDGRLAGVRVLAHKETPGLGDYIEERRSPWIHGFDGRGLGDPAPERWAVRRDGGAFDHVTGATVTPRAIVAALARSLEAYALERERLFALETAP